MRLANCTPPSSGSRAIPFALSKGGARPWRAAGGHGPGTVRINRGYRHTPSESSCAAAGIECEGGLHSNVHLRAGHHCWPEVHHADSALAWLLALASVAAGLLAERWFFFAQARHPQNIYYQAVS